MTQVTFRSDVTVDLVQVSGSEELIADAAWVSTNQAREEEKDPKRIKGLIKRLLKDEHGTPFEYPEFIFYVEMPIFCDRQIVKYRQTTINGSSGRYSENKPQFYVCPRTRKAIQVGKTMDYNFEMGEDIHYEALEFVHRSTAEAAWQNYQSLLDIGVAKELAREHMPLTNYVSMYIKINLRSLLNLLHQRLDLADEVTVIDSHPQEETSWVAQGMAEYVKEYFPNVWDAFVESGYRKL